MKTNKRPLLPIVLTIFLVGCFGGDGPSADKLRSNFLLNAHKLGSSVDIGDFNIEITDNVGTEVEPVYKSRIKTTFTIKEPFYKVDSHVDNVAVLVKSAEKDASSAVTLISRSVDHAGKWDIRFEDMQVANSMEGQPLSGYSRQKYVLKDSGEHKALVDKVRAEEEERARIAVEEEAKKIQALKDARAKLTGTWVGQKPIIADGEYDYIMYKHSSPELKLHYSLEFPDNESNQVTVTYFTNPESKRFSIDARFWFDGPSKLRIKELEEIKIAQFRWHTTGIKWEFDIRDAELHGTAYANRYNYEVTISRDGSSSSGDTTLN
jgi:hypothetical protein